MMFNSSNKPRAVFRGHQTFICECTGRWFPGCAPCDDSLPDGGGNDPNPPSNCAWQAGVLDGTGSLGVSSVPLNSTMIINSGPYSNDTSITFYVSALASPAASITVLSSNATGLDGTSTYTGATPVVPVGNTLLVGTLDIDTSTPGNYSATVTIVTDCSTIVITVNYTIVAP